MGPILAAIVMGLSLNSAPKAQLSRHFKAHRIEASVRLVLPTGKSALALESRKTIYAKEAKAYSDFVKQAKKDLAEPGDWTAPYTYEATKAAVYQSKTLISYVVLRDAYNAGAHGMQYKVLYVFGTLAGRPVPIHLGDIVAKDHFGDVERKLFFLATAKDGTDWIRDGSKTGFDQMELDHLWADDKGLHWEFDPYELGSYASGPFTFSLSWKELQPWLVDSDWVKGNSGS